MKTSRHVVQITNVEVYDRAALRELGEVEVPDDTVVITVEGTSKNDRRRQYVLDGEDWNNNVFEIEEIQYVAEKKKKSN